MTLNLFSGCHHFSRANRMLKQTLQIVEEVIALKPEIKVVS